MSNYTNFQSDAEILRLAEQERGEAMGAFFRWLFVDRNRDTADNAANVVAAE